MLLSRKSGWAALAAAALLLVSPAAKAERTKLDFWFGLTGDLGERVKDVCKRFNDSQPDYEVVCTSQGGYPEAVQNTIAAYRAGKHPTIVQVFDVGTLDLMLSGAIYPAKKLMADFGHNIDWSDYFGGIANYYATAKGDLWSFPFNSSTAVFYWNKDAFAKIGQDHGPATWEEFEADSAALKKAGYECPMAFDFDTWAFMEQFSAIHGQPIASNNNGYDGLDTELLFNKTKFVDMVTLFKKLFDDKQVVIKKKATGQSIVEAFSSGTCQMMMSSIADHGTVAKTAAPEMKWDVTMLPIYQGTERRNSMVGGASLWVMAGKSDAEYKGAAAFFDFIGTPESTQYWSTVTGYIPVRKSGFDAMKANGFYDKAPYKGREIAIASLTYTPTTPLSRGIRVGGMIEIRKEVRDALEGIFIGKTTVQQGLDEVVARGNTIIKRFAKTYAGKELP